jgi:DNA-binding MarR family transcriptional regulator
MSESAADDVGAHPGGPVGELRRDWLAVLLDQVVRTAGLLHVDEQPEGDRVSMSESFALMELAEHAPLTQRDLAERLELEKSTVSRLVAGLERRKLVTRHRNPHNRRFFHVALTEHGRAVIHGLAAAMLEHHARIFATMTPGERDALATGVSALVRAMEQARHASPPAAHS